MFTNRCGRTQNVFHTEHLDVYHMFLILEPAVLFTGFAILIVTTVNNS